MEHNGIRATLYLGANIRGQYEVNRDRFEAFLNEYVTPRFSGFTVRSTLGYWLGKPEFSRELVILADGPMTPEFKRQIEQIGRDYKSRFSQDAVMVTYEPVHVLFDVPGDRVKPVMGERAI